MRLSISKLGLLAARLGRVEVESQAAAAGLFIQDGWRDAPYSPQRLDEITLRLLAVEADRRRITGERATLDAQIAAEERLVAARETFHPAALAPGRDRGQRGRPLRMGRRYCRRGASERAPGRRRAGRVA